MGPHRPPQVPRGRCRWIGAGAGCFPRPPPGQEFRQDVGASGKMRLSGSRSALAIRWMMAENFFATYCKYTLTTYQGWITSQTNLAHEGRLLEAILKAEVRC